jgi:hypothetical protein
LKLLLLLQLRQTLSDTQAEHEEEFTKRAEHALLTDMRAPNQQKPYDEQYAALDKNPATKDADEEEQQLHNSG